MLIESALAVALLAIVAAGLLWMRGTGRALVSPEERLVSQQVVDRLPTDVPTFTPAPTATRPAPETSEPAGPDAGGESVTYVVAGGDTLEAIADRYGVDAGSLAELNGLDAPESLQVGQRITVTLGPGLTSDDAVADADAPSAGADHAEASIGDADAETDGPADEVAQEPASGDAAPADPGEPLVIEEPQIHVLVAGDTFGGIAVEYGLSLDELLALNADRIGSVNDTLMVGDEVVVKAAVVVTPTAGPPAGAPPTVPPIAAAPGAAAAVPFEPAAHRRYPSPAVLSPADGARVSGEAPWIRWSSVGVLPRGIGYVVSIRDADAPDERLVTQWVTGNATGLRVPGDLRPQRGAERRLEWSVSVQLRGGGVFDAEGTPLGPEPVWFAFTWAPGG